MRSPSPRLVLLALLLLALALLLPGCLALSFGGRTTTQTTPPPCGPAGTSEVWGYGQGESKLQAEKAAWDDAVARMKAMGFADGHHIAKTLPDGSPGVPVQQHFEAAVHLQITG